MPKKTKAERVTEHPMNVRLSRELFDRVEALTPTYGARSIVLRLALAEGLTVMERRARGQSQSKK